MTIRCAILDDHHVVREALGLLLDAEPDLEVVGTCDTEADLLELVRLHRPDLVLLDLDLPRCDSFEAGAAARKLHPPLRLVALTAFPTDTNIARALKRRFDGFLTKSESAEVVLDAIRQIAEGDSVFSEAVLERCNPAAFSGLGEPKMPTLTARELAVVKLAAQGLSSREIADELSRSHRTIENQLNSAMKRAGVNTRVDLVRWAIREGIVQP
ncbi:MAG: response regulator transcription factor [Phycisphaerales bacterium]|nr:response regulator transcription factor [Phycisphaerales bacterium]